MSTIISRLRALLARKEVVALVDQGVASVTNFASGVIVGRACTRDDFGAYALGLSIVLLATSLQDVFISTPYMVFSPRLQGPARARYTGSTLVHQIFLSLLASLGLVAAAVAFGLGIGPPRLAAVSWVLAAVLTLIMLRDYVRRLCFAGILMKTALAIDCCVAVLQVGGLLVLWQLGLLSPDRAYWVVGGACGAAALAWITWERKQFALRIGQAVADFLRNWSFAKWVFASGLLWDVSMNLYPWFLAAFHGTGSTGTWAACLGVVSLGNPALLGIQNYLGPRIMHYRAANGSEMLHGFIFRVSAAFCGLVMVFCLALWLFGDRLVVLVYGAQYAGNGLVVAVMALNLVVSASVFAFSRGLFAIERTDVDFTINTVALGLLLTVGIWLVRSFGPLGAALGLLLTNSVMSAVKCTVFSLLVRSSARSQAA